jgi:hypothetical protein
VDQPQYTSSPLEELRRIEAEIHRAKSVEDLRVLFDRLNSIRRTFIDDFDVQLAIGDVQQEIVDRGRVLHDTPFDPHRHSPPPPPSRQKADVFLQEEPPRENPAEPIPASPPENVEPNVHAIDARTWKRATYIGAFIALIVLAVFFYLVQSARKLNFETPESQSANQAKTTSAQQKPNPAVPASGQPTPAPTNPTLRLYTDLVPGAVSIDGGAQQDLQDGELQLDTLKPGSHSVKLTGRTGSATVAFNAAEKTSPDITAPPAGDNAMVVAVSTQNGQGRLMTNASDSVAVLDGKDLGTIPATGLALSNLGNTDHDLLVRRGSDSERFVLTYVPAPALTVFVKSDLNAGNLVVLTGEDDADVFINNQKYKRQTSHGQIRLPNLKTGSYTIRVAKDGFIAPPSQTVQIKKGEEARVAFQLKPQPPPPASLAISGGQPGTQVLIDGQPVATVGIDGMASASNINAGDHQIELIHDGSEPKHLQRSFTAGQAVTLTGADVALAKIPPKETAAPPKVAPPPEQSEQETALAAAEAEPATMPASIHKGGGFLIYHTTKAPGHYVFTMQLRHGGGFLKSKHLQWFVGYQNTKNYVLFQVDGKHFTVKQVVDGKSDEIRKVPFDGDPQGYIQIDMAVKPHAVDVRLKPDTGGWEDMGSVGNINPDLTKGKFGVLISGNDEIGISTVHYGK